MGLDFFKYTGAGNDFILIDNREHSFPDGNTALIRELCDRHFGVGGDGLLLLENSEQAAFRMRIFNADGSEASMCGNGLRCFKAFLTDLGHTKPTYEIEVGNRLLKATTIDEDNIEVEMGNPLAVDFDLGVPVAGFLYDCDWIDVGVPHLICMVDDLEEIPVDILGPALRYHEHFEPNGTNVNFVELRSPTEIAVRTYERGVEAETWACGSGSTAAALTAAHRLGITTGPIQVIVASGTPLMINFSYNNGTFTDVTMSGPATPLFRGCWLSPVAVG